jgi:dCTP deaminase
MTLSVGRFFWIPCEVKPGPFSDERLARIADAESVWVGFVETSALQSPIEEGWTALKAVMVTSPSPLGTESMRLRSGPPSRKSGRLVLSRPDIVHALRSGQVRVEPALSEDRVMQVSIDLTLGRKFTRLAVKPAYLPAIHVDPSLWQSKDLWETVESDTYRLEKGAFVLAHTLERVTLPSDLVGLVEGRSSFARAGISVHVTAPKIDPGFAGTITLEMFNFSSVPVDLRAGIDQPAQLMLLRISTPLDHTEVYGSGSGDVFQGQDSPLPRRRSTC